MKKKSIKEKAAQTLARPHVPKRGDVLTNGSGDAIVVRVYAGAEPDDWYELTLVEGKRGVVVRAGQPYAVDLCRKDHSVFLTQEPSKEEEFPNTRST